MRLTRQSVHVNSMCGQADAHVAIAALGHDAHLEVVEPAGRGDGVCRAHAGRVLVCLAVTCSTPPRNVVTTSRTCEAPGGAGAGMLHCLELLANVSAPSLPRDCLTRLAPSRDSRDIRLFVNRTYISDNFDIESALIRRTKVDINIHATADV